MPELIKGPQAEKLLTDAGSVDDVDVGPISFPYARLSPGDFELLLYALFKVDLVEDHTHSYDDVALMLEGADQGRDVVLYDKQAPVGIVQCKRLDFPMSLPAVLREVIKLLLFAKVEPDLLPESGRLEYALAVAKDPTGPALEFFSQPRGVLAKQDPLLQGYIDEVIEDHASFQGLDRVLISSSIRARLPELSYRLIRPADLDAWVKSRQKVQIRFFRPRIVVDSTDVMASFAEIMGVLRERLPVPITDEDVDLVTGRIREVPESHRFSVGLAKFFGYPKEMFTGEDNLRPRLELIGRFNREMTEDFTKWLFAKASALADGICQSGPVVFSTHPFARQIPSAFLGQVCREVLQSRMGDVLQRSIKRQTKDTDSTMTSDEQKLTNVLKHLLDRGSEVIRGDYSAYAQPPELFELKKRVITFAVEGLSADADIELALHRGLSVMHDSLYAAAHELRRLGGQKRTIVVQELDFLDNDREVARMLSSVGGASTKKERNEPPAQV